MSQYLVERIHSSDNIKVIGESEVVGVEGADRLESVTIRHIGSDDEQTVQATAMFIFIGAIPHTDWLEGVASRDEHGFVLTGPDLAKHDLRSGGRSTVARTYWRPAFPVCSPLATSAMARSSGSPLPWGRAQLL